MIDGIPNRPLYFYLKDIIETCWTCWWLYPWDLSQQHIEKIPAQAIDSTPDLEVRCFEVTKHGGDRDLEGEVTKQQKNKMVELCGFKVDFRWI